MSITYLKDAVSAAVEDLLDRATGESRAPQNLSAADAARLAGMKGRLHQLNCSQGGVPKLPVAGAELTEAGLEGDRQKHTSFHGGPERALSLFSLEVIERLRAEGHPISPGSTGENVTVSGLDWPLLSPGTRLAIGERAVVQITSYANPCGSIRPSFAAGKFKRISQKINPGESRLYARVLRPGRLAAGDEVRVLGEDEPDAGRDPKLAREVKD